MAASEYTSRLGVRVTPAFRTARRGFVSGSLEDFQHGGGGHRSAVLRALRNAELRGAAHVLCPSDYLRSIAVGWGLEPDRVSVLRNPVPPLPELPERGQLRSSLGLNGATLAFAGRITRQKSLEVALEALARADGVSLVVAGEGDEVLELQRRAGDLGLGDRVRFLGPLPRNSVLELFRAADAALLSSSWENFPHTVVEALAVGTPVLATSAGGVGEVLYDGRNGLLVDQDDRRIDGEPDGVVAETERELAQLGPPVLGGTEDPRDVVRGDVAGSLERDRPDALGRLRVGVEDVDGRGALHGEGRGDPGGQEPGREQRNSPHSGPAEQLHSGRSPRMIPRISLRARRSSSLSRLSKVFRPFTTASSTLTLPRRK